MSLTPPATEEPPPPVPLMELTVKPAFPALSLSRMVGMAYAKDRSDRPYAVLQPGRIVSFPNDPGADSTEMFLDIRDRVNDRGEEEGLLGLAFDPQYAANGHFYVYYSASGPRRSVVSRFSVSTDGRRADPGSERVFAGGPPALLKPQRRPDSLRPGRIPVHRPGRRRKQGRPAGQRPEPEHAPGLDPFAST